MNSLGSHVTAAVLVVALLLLAQPDDTGGGPAMTQPRRGIDQMVGIASDRLDLASIPAPPAWVEEALCAQIDQEGFFPEKGGSTRQAIKTCAMCPVTAKCLEYALDNRERFGVWGGKTERERRRMLRERGVEL